MYSPMVRTCVAWDGVGRRRSRRTILALLNVSALSRDDGYDQIYHDIFFIAAPLHATDWRPVWFAICGDAACLATTSFFYRCAIISGSDVPTRQNLYLRLTLYAPRGYRNASHRATLFALAVVRAYKTCNRTRHRHACGRTRHFNICPTFLWYGVYATRRGETHCL